MVRSCPIWPDMTQNGPTWFKMVKTGQLRFQIVQNSPGWFTPCPKWYKMVQNIKKCIIWCTMGQFLSTNHPNGSVITRSPGLVFFTHPILAAMGIHFKDNKYFWWKSKTV